ncbi:LLM class flavin-dependent oxidoreductase [Humidisolicoccus flavus]|uniref:LLM class flavin-dependent oxidoreductase n=1 Tax=Humidisolicoccus flavus TaxID=3111414 RepID=UPI003255426D
MNALRFGLALAQSPGDPRAAFREIEARAIEAEQAGFDFVTLADPLDQPNVSALSSSETLAALARTTKRIGLFVAAGSHYTEPFHTAKAVATIDFASRGRAGLIVDASSSQVASQRFPHAAHLSNEELAAEAAEFIEVLRELWDSWEDDAEIRDTASARYVDSSKIHHIDHAGAYFTVKGPLITPRPPQGNPLVAVRSGASQLAHGAAARSGADLVFLDAEQIDLSDATALPSEIRNIIMRIDASRTAEDRIEAFVEIANAHPAVVGIEFVQVEGALDDVLRNFTSGDAGGTDDAGSLRARFGFSRPSSRYETSPLVAEQ